ncbi:hypothetical protein [Patulibacter sp.]|uniref:hypothetical protein n=1 Tax=Patulibacter sp. TaxID=1912859 RepID=UPI00271B768B|nr:hypothetical protein [Patulibacter sp.]MDO9410396.1 hypothetical protein [Patulibacter sp.]
MTGRARGRTTTIGATALVALLAGGPAAGAQTPDDGRLTLRDTLYVLPLGPPAATPDCVLVLCPLVQPFAPVGSGPDAGTTGLRVTGLPVAPPRVVAESRSEPTPYDGANPSGTASLTLSADSRADGSGGTVTTSVRLEEVGGGTVAELPAAAVPLDGAKHTSGPLAIDPSRLVVGRAYVAVARFSFSVPAGGSVAARVAAPRLLARGPRRAAKAPAALKPGRPVVRLRGRRLQVTARCPSGGARCELQVRSALQGRTLGKGAVELQAAARHTFTWVLSAAQLRRARRVGLISTTLRVEDENGRTGQARRSLRLAAR